MTDALRLNPDDNVATLLDARDSGAVLTAFDLVLSEPIARGHKVALNTLNYGRFSLGGMCTGGCRAVIAEAGHYALVLALALALIQSIVPVIGARFPLSEAAQALRTLADGAVPGKVVIDIG